jgi:hypothetical protein
MKISSYSPPCLLDNQQPTFFPASIHLLKEVKKRLQQQICYMMVKVENKGSLSSG